MASRVLQHDLACTACGYNLRGLGVDAQCPECGQSVRRSFGGRLLRFADRRWLERLSFGLWLMHRSAVAGCLAVLLLPVIGGVVSWILYQRDAPSGYLTTWRIIGSLAAAIVASAAAAGLAGAFLATQAEPSGTRHLLPLRPAARPALLLLFPSVIAVLVVGVLQMARQIPLVHLGWWIAVAAVLCAQGAALATWLNRIDADVDARGYDSWWDAAPDRRALAWLLFRTSHRGSDSARFGVRYVLPPIVLIAGMGVWLWPTFRPLAYFTAPATTYVVVYVLWTMGRTVACVRNELIESNARQ